MSDFQTCKCGLLTVTQPRLVECLYCRTLTSYPYSRPNRRPRMLRVQLPTLLLGISFQREYVNARSKKGHGPNVELRSTACELHRLNAEGKSEAIIGRGYVKCDSRDSFRLEVGRKKALARALRVLQLTKANRTTVWQTYLDRPRPVSKPKPAAVKLQPQPTLQPEFVIPSVPDATGTSEDFHAGEI